MRRAYRLFSLTPIGVITNLTINIGLRASILLAHAASLGSEPTGRSMPASFTYYPNDENEERHAA